MPLGVLYVGPLCSVRLGCTEHVQTLVSHQCCNLSISALSAAALHAHTHHIRTMTGPCIAFALAAVEVELVVFVDAMLHR
jgi:hypothetical protein